MKKIIKMLLASLALVLVVGCDDENYGPVDDIKPMRTYMATMPEYNSFIIKNEIYQMFIYRDIPKVTIFNSLNWSNCKIYETKNFVDETVEMTSEDGTYKYKVYKVEFDAIISVSDDGTEVLHHYSFEADMDPEPVLNSEGNYSYRTRKMTRTVSGKATTIQKVELVDAERYMDK